MTDTYTVLWDMSRSNLDEPFRGRLESLSPGGASSARVQRAELTKREVRDLARAPEVAAVAPVMPTNLIAPVSNDEAGVEAAADPAPGGVAWESRPWEPSLASVMVPVWCRPSWTPASTPPIRHSPA